MDLIFTPKQGGKKKKKTLVLNAAWSTSLNELGAQVKK
jgi:hypothetical protein